MKNIKSFVILLFCLFCFSAGSYKSQAQNINPLQINWSRSTGCSTAGTVYSPSTNACVTPGSIAGSSTVIYPAVCQGSNAPTWCGSSSQTADVFVREACAQLPAAGGTINLSGLTGVLAASMPCSTATKQVIMVQDLPTLLTITESDGGVVFPIANGSMFLGPPGGGQCPLSGGIHLGASASVSAVWENSDSSGDQEFFSVQGVCFWGSTSGSPGAVSVGVIVANHVFTNTTFLSDVISVCPTACMKVINVGGTLNIGNVWLNVTSGVYAVQGSPLVVTSTSGLGCGSGSINIWGSNLEHANGSGQNEAQIVGNGTGAVNCSVFLHDTYFEKNTSGTPSTVSLQVTDCLSCSFSNLSGGGGNGTPSGDFVNVAQTASGRLSNVQFYNISNIIGSWANTINDVTPLGTVITQAAYPIVSTYISNPGFQQPPVLPSSTIQSLGADVMNGYGNFATGSGTLPTNFAVTGCVTASGVTCTTTRTNSTAPAGFTYSEEIAITANTDPSSGFNGMQYSSAVSFVQGQAYQVSFYGKTDGTFTNGYPTFLLWISTTSTFYCNASSSTPFTTTWTLYSFVCTPSVSGNANLAISARTPIGATGNFFLAGFTFAPVQPLTQNTYTAAVGPYGIGSSVLGTSIGVGTGAPTSTCGTAPTASGSLWLRTDGSTSTTLYVCTGTTWTAK